MWRKQIVVIEHSWILKLGGGNIPLVRDLSTTLVATTSNQNG